MTTGEMAYLGIVEDYFKGLVESQKTSVVGNGHILILPSVNSDKPTIGRLLINLNSKVNVLDSNIGEVVQKALNDCTSEDLRMLIKDELGNMYIKMFTKIRNDWQLVDNFIRQNATDPVIQSMPPIHENIEWGFKKINDWFWANRAILE
jgi:hypothetical protein